MAIYIAYPPEGRHRRMQCGQGFSMVEIAMVLSIVSLIVAGVMLFAMNATESRKEKDALEELADVLSIVRAQYDGMPDFTGLNGAMVVGSKQLPNKWVHDPSSIATPWGGILNVTDASSGFGTSVIRIEFPNVPGPGCFRLATSDLGSSVVQYVVNGTVLANGPFLPAAASTLCQQGTGNDVYWDFN
jgi:prepilin-type N-terminal cleavage/methylation domain-containing protein